MDLAYPDQPPPTLIDLAYPYRRLPAGVEVEAVQDGKKTRHLRRDKETEPSSCKYKILSLPQGLHMR